MKISKLEKLIFLEQSGELSARQRRVLDACQKTQEKRADLKSFFEAVPVSTPEPEPWATQRIVARLRKEQRWGFTFSKVWKPVFLVSACLVLAVSTLDFKDASTEVAVVADTEVDAWGDQFEEDLVELESLILAMSGDLVVKM